jgi:hypothetical protein
MPQLGFIIIFWLGVKIFMWAVMVSTCPGSFFVRVKNLAVVTGL